MSGCGTYSEGERSGELVKFSKKGLVCKTWEGQMNTGGVSNGAANTWEFTVEDEGVAKILQNKLGQKIDVNYKQEVMTGPCRSETNYFVKSTSST